MADDLTIPDAVIERTVDRYLAAIEAGASPGLIKALAVALSVLCRGYTAERRADAEDGPEQTEEELREQALRLRDEVRARAAPEPAEDEEDDEDDEDEANDDLRAAGVALTVDEILAAVRRKRTGPPEGDPVPTLAKRVQPTARPDST